MNVQLTANGLPTILSMFSRVQREAWRTVVRTNVAFSMEFLAALQQAASGHPGPGVVTGAYREGFYIDLVDGGINLIAGNDSPQAHRLEYGFVGVDSMGRHYNQGPFPHFRPTIDKMGPRYVAMHHEALAGLIRG